MRFLTEVASDHGLEPGALRLGVQAKCPNYMRNAPFYSFLCVLCSIFHPFCIIYCCLNGVFYAFQQVQKQKHYQNITNFRKKSDIRGISKPQYLQGKNRFFPFLTAKNFIDFFGQFRPYKIQLYRVHIPFFTAFRCVCCSISQQEYQRREKPT